MNKQETRREIKRIKLEISQQERELAAIEVMNKIESLPQFTEAENILLYKKHIIAFLQNYKKSASSTKIKFTF